MGEGGWQDWKKIERELKDAGMRVVDSKEVQKSFGKEEEGWKNAVEKELMGLLEIGAIMKVPAEDAVIVPKYKVVPSKLVYAVKPPDETGVRLKKARLVACGNMDRREVTETLSTYQVEPMSFRASLVEGMARGWQCTILDVKQAFLSVFIKGTEQDIFILPPAMLHKHGYCEKGELYRVVRALYGLKQSPKRWQEHRDKTLQGLRVKGKTGLVDKLPIRTELH